MNVQLVYTLHRLGYARQLCYLATCVYEPTAVLSLRAGNPPKASPVDDSCNEDDSHNEGGCVTYTALLPLLMIPLVVSCFTSGATSETQDQCLYKGAGQDCVTQL